MLNSINSSVTHYRKQIGSYNERQKITTKSINKAIRKAHNASESIHTHRSRSRTNTSNTMRVALKTMGILAVAASVMTPVGALENGVRNTNGPSDSTFCLVGLGKSSKNYLNQGSCTGFKINHRQIVTAKHCAQYAITQKKRIWAKTRDAGIAFAAHKNDHPDPNVDLSIFTFPKDLAGYTYCLPIMTEDTQDLLKKSPSNICGLEGRAIIEARGTGSTEKSELFSYPFDFADQIQSTRKLTVLNGGKNNNQPVCVRQGDSGAPVLGCNPKTGGYELMGFFTTAIWVDPNPCDKRKAGFVDITYFSEVKHWLLNNTQPCVSTDGYSMRPNDFFQTNAHSWNKCRIPMEHDAQAGISLKERCDCYYNNFETPPESLNCPSKNKGIAACVDISTVEHTSGNEAKPSKIIIKNSCNGSVAIGLFATANDGFTRRIEERINQGGTEEINLHAEETLNKTIGIKFKRQVGTMGIVIPKFFETPLSPAPALNATVVTEANATASIEPSTLATTEANATTIELNTTSTAETNATTAIELSTLATTPANATAAIALNTTSTSETNATTKSDAKPETKLDFAFAARKHDQAPPAKNNTSTRFFAGAAGLAALGLATAVAVTCSKKRQNSAQFSLVPTNPSVV